MKSMVIWAQSDCRSTMGLYKELMHQVNVPVTIALWFYKNIKEGCSDNRSAVGFSKSEFADIPMIPVGDDFAKGIAVLDQHPESVHVFTVFQNSAVWRRLIVEARRRGEKVVIACESPCNMDSGVRKVLKEGYMRLVLPWKARKVIAAAECFINYSGDDDKYARIIGWPKDKIIPFGYFPPPIPGSCCVRRTGNRPFEILATGLITWHRGCDVLVEALKILKERGIAFHATITQDGPLKKKLEEKARRNHLPVDFVGFVSLTDLKRSYETCSVYVGVGRHEPWGMRLNDALNCGTPLVVSRGMGGVKMVDDYHCGLAFENENPRDLADKFLALMTDSALYDQCANNAVIASRACTPENKAKELVDIFRQRKWL